MAANFFVPQAVCSEVVSCNPPPLTATAPGNAATDGPTCSHKRRPRRRQSGRRRQVLDRRQRQRLRARKAAVVHRVTSAPPVLLVREKARHARHVELTDLEGVVRLRETASPDGRKELRITEAYLKFPSARRRSRKRYRGEAQHILRRNGSRNRYGLRPIPAVLCEEVVRSGHSEAARRILVRAASGTGALKVQITTGTPM